MTRTRPPDVHLPRALGAIGGSVRDVRAQSAIPRLAKDREAIERIAVAAANVPTSHRLVRGDARRLIGVGDESVHLVLTSPPYWTLKEYREHEGQLGHVADYDEFLRQLDRVWAECFRVLAPGGRLVVVVGDVCLSRKAAGRHSVVPLHAAIQEHCRALGFDNLAPIIWHKIANAKFEVENGSGGFLGKPYEPNAVVKNDIEFILMQRKGGAYRQPTLGMRLLSVIPEREHKEWFQQIWRLGGASTREHPAPYPLVLSERLIRMFSFVGDTILDPFAGTGTTSAAAAAWGRNSIGFEIDPHYVALARDRLFAIANDMFASRTVTIEDAAKTPPANGRAEGASHVAEGTARYGQKPRRRR